MWRPCNVISLLLFLSACASPIVWGNADTIEQNLIRVLPLGSSVSELQNQADKRGWRIDNRNIVIVSKGTATYFNDTDLLCRGAGGPVITSLVSQYWSPFDTSVEVQWVFDKDRRLRDLCVRKTIDML